MLLLDGKRLVYGRAFSSNGVSYPANWLALTSREDHEAIGITYADDPAPAPVWDQRWAWGYLDDGSLNWKEFSQKKQNSSTKTIRSPVHCFHLLTTPSHVSTRKELLSLLIPVHSAMKSAASMLHVRLPSKEPQPLRSCTALVDLLICHTPAALLNGRQLVKLRRRRLLLLNHPARNHLSPQASHLLRVPKRAALNKHKKAGLSQGPARGSFSELSAPHLSYITSGR